MIGSSGGIRWEGLDGGEGDIGREKDKVKSRKRTGKVG